MPMSREGTCLMNANRTLWLLVALSVFSLGCGGGPTMAARVTATPQAQRVRVGTGDPPAASREIGPIEISHGGCTPRRPTLRGRYASAYAMLRNEAVRRGADYVKILTVTEPIDIGAECRLRAFSIRGIAYRLPASHARREPEEERVVPNRAGPIREGRSDGIVVGLRRQLQIGTHVVSLMLRRGGDAQIEVRHASNGDCDRLTVEGRSNAEFALVDHVAHLTTEELLELFRRGTVVRSCSLTWQLSSPDLQAIRELIARYTEIEVETSSAPPQDAQDATVRSLLNTVAPSFRACIGEAGPIRVEVDWDDQGAPVLFVENAAESELACARSLVELPAGEAGDELVHVLPPQ